MLQIKNLLAEEKSVLAVNGQEMWDFCQLQRQLWAKEVSTEKASGQSVGKLLRDLAKRIAA